MRNPPWRGDRKIKKKYIVAIRNQTCSLASRAIYKNWPPQTLPRTFLPRINLLSLFLCHQDLFTYCSILQSLVFKPILYKSIVLGFLGLSPSIFWAKSSNQALTVLFCLFVCLFVCLLLLLLFFFFFFNIFLLNYKLNTSNEYNILGFNKQINIFLCVLTIIIF